MRIEIEHPNSYTTQYGHLSVIIVKQGQSVIADPNDRQGIIGISGSTGNSDGPHLHFGLTNPDDIYVNPYGWQGPAGQDPWELSVPPEPQGAISHDVWEQYPAIQIVYTLEELQYPSGSSVEEPSVNDYLVEVDNSNAALFSTYGDCWIDYTLRDCWTGEDNAAGLYGDYHYAPANRATVSFTQWSFDPNAFAPAGEYDIYVHIPDPATSLSAEYTIFHQNQENTAIVVQAAYPNDVHDNWVYLGRYQFDMNGSNEYIRLNIRNLVTMTEDTDGILIADAIRLMPVDSLPDLEVAVVVSSDDAGPNPVEWPEPSDACSATDPKFATTHNEVYFGHCPDGTDMVSGFRFQNVTIPQGSVITSAYLEFTVDGMYDNIIDVLFQGELVGDSVTFSDINRPSDRMPLTTASVIWHIEDEWGAWRTHRSPDLSTVIQEIVNQLDWTSGNDLALFAQSSGSGTSHRRVFAWDRLGNSYQVAKLQIWYTETEPPPPPPAPTNLKAIYDDGMPGPGQSVLVPIPQAPIPMPHVGLSWKPMLPEAGITYNVYRNTTSPVPVDATHRIAAGLDKGSYDDYDGVVGDYYVVTAVKDAVESDPSNTARAR